MSTDGIDVPRCSANQRPDPLLGGADAGQLPSVRQQLPVQVGRPGRPQGQGRRVLIVPVAATSPDQAAQDQIHHVRIIGQGGRDRPQAGAQQQPPDGRVLGLHERRGRGGQGIDAVSAWLPVAAGFEPPDHLDPDLQRRSRVTGLGIEQINHPLGSFPSDGDRQGRGNLLQPIADRASQQVRPWERRRRRRSDGEGCPGRPAEGLVEHGRYVFTIEAHRATAAAHHPECFSAAIHRHLNPIGLGPRSPHQAIYLSPIVGDDQIAHPPLALVGGTALCGAVVQEAADSVVIKRQRPGHGAWCEILGNGGFSPPPSGTAVGYHARYGPENRSPSARRARMVTAKRRRWCGRSCAR